MAFPHGRAKQRTSYRRSRSAKSVPLLILFLLLWSNFCCLFRSNQCTHTSNQTDSKRPHWPTAQIIAVPQNEKQTSFISHSCHCGLVGSCNPQKLPPTVPGGERALEDPGSAMTCCSLHGARVPSGPKLIGRNESRDHSQLPLIQEAQPTMLSELGEQGLSREQQDRSPPPALHLVFELSCMSEVHGMFRTGPVS